MDPDEQALIADPAKARAILQACSRADLDQLRALAESRGGLLSDHLRQQAWPLLLGLPRDLVHNTKPDAFEDGNGAGSWKELPRHRDEDQVQLDVNRAFVHYPKHDGNHELQEKKDELSALIIHVLRQYPYLCYFQGYHDICQVLLLVLAPHLLVPAVARLSALRIRDFMLPSLQPAISHLRLIPDILRLVDPALWRHLSATEPFFALSGTLTMYAHDITSLGEITRLFDVLLAREPVFTVYMFAAIVRSRRDELFDIPHYEPEMLHSILSKLPRPLDIDALVMAAANLMHTYPPEHLRVWRTISSASVLKTARGPARLVAAQTMQDAKCFFDKQAKELEVAERRERLRKVLSRYQGPAGALGLAILIGAMAIWIRRSPGPYAYVVGYWSRWSL